MFLKRFYQIKEMKNTRIKNNKTGIELKMFLTIYRDFNRDVKWLEL